MIKTILSYILFLFMLLLIIGIGIQYYISRDVESKELVCHKGRLLTRVGDDGAVYTKVKGLTCDIQKGMLIIEEQ